MDHQSILGSFYDGYILWAKLQILDEKGAIGLVESGQVLQSFMDQPITVLIPPLQPFV
jgi:hypothetical protein